MTELKGKGATEPEVAPFDDTAAALRFALNADQVTVPASYMSRVMAEFTPTPKRKKPTRAERAVLNAVGLCSLDELRERIRGSRRSSKPRPPRPTRGLDAAHLAGFILREFSKLPDVHQMVLTGLLTHPVVPCTCGRLCCSGFMPVQRWVDAVDRTCEVLKDKALLEANAGLAHPVTGVLMPPPPGTRMKVGLSTQPALRRALVKDFYRGDQKRPLVVIAARHQLTDETVAKHRGWIFAWLEEQEAKAWESANWWFNQVGITGPWL